MKLKIIFSPCVHFLQRTKLMDKIRNKSPLFNQLNKENQFIWIMANYDTEIIQAFLAKYVKECHETEVFSLISAWYAVMYINIYIITLAKKITVFASGLLFLYCFFLILFISYNIAMKCLICLCMVSYTLDMQIGSLWGLKFFIWPFDLERSRSKVKVTRACDLSKRSYHRLEYDGDKTFHFRADLD